MYENSKKNGSGREMTKSYVDSALLATMVKAFGVRAVLQLLERQIASGVQLVINVAGAIDNPLHLNQPEWFEKQLENGAIVCYLYSGGNILEELNNMFFQAKGQAGFAFSAFPACINWTGKYAKPRTLEELLDLVAKEAEVQFDESGTKVMNVGPLADYEVSLCKIIKLLSRKAVPQKKFNPDCGWTPREGVQPNVEELAKLLDRPAIRDALEAAGKQPPQWNRRSAGLGFLLWLSEKQLLKDDKLQRLVIEVFYLEYSAAQAVQKGCADEEGHAVVALADLLQSDPDKVFAAFCELYKDMSTGW